MRRGGLVIAGAIACCLFGAPTAPAAELPERCDMLDPSVCLYPWPNDHFTRVDPTTPTGRRLAIDPASTPVNRLGQRMNVVDQNRADGFSPGNLIVTKVPGLDSQAAFGRTGLVPEADPARFFEPDQPVVVIDADSGERQPIWAEIDANPSNPRDVTLIVRPARNLAEGHRFIVALRHLEDAAGNTLQPRAQFRGYRDGIDSNDDYVAARRGHFEDIFDRLEWAGIARDDLYLAWDFTVASEHSLSGRALRIRDDAFGLLGDDDLADRTVQGRSPSFTPNPDLPDDLVDALSALPIPDLPLPISLDRLDGYREYPSGPTARRITGTIQVPCYLKSIACLPGLGFNLDRSGVPRRVQGSYASANVICTVPRSAVDGSHPEGARVSLYGHGLLGSAGEVGGGNVQAMGDEHDVVFCATDWAGMSTIDVPNVLGLLQNLSNFRSLADRSQQGFLNFMYLGRWLIHPDGASKAAGFPRLDTRRLFYDGNSQGGILGGALTALAPDFDRAVLGVPGMNYSTLLRRSVDFDMYAHGEIEGLQLPIGLYQNYPDELERPLVLSLMQLLWDRGEANGYAQHMTTDPLQGTPEHRVLLHPAVGDHQVANVTADVEARTIGACVRRPAFDPGRTFAVEPLWGVRRFGDPECHGSGIVYWDTGPGNTPVAPLRNVPPRTGKDPHSAPRSTKAARAQKSAFLQIDGSIPDVCAGEPCRATGYKP
jgi:hypothetical protein